MLSRYVRRTFDSVVPKPDKDITSNVTLGNQEIIFGKKNVTLSQSVLKMDETACNFHLITLSKKDMVSL